MEENYGKYCQYYLLLRRRLLAQERHIPALVGVRREERHAQGRAVRGGGLAGRGLELHHLGVAMLTHLGGRSMAVASASWTALRRAAPGRRRGAQAAVALHAALDSAVGACVASAARLSIYLPIYAYLSGA